MQPLSLARLCWVVMRCSGWHPTASNETAGRQAETVCWDTKRCHGSWLAAVTACQAVSDSSSAAQSLRACFVRCSNLLAVCADVPEQPVSIDASTWLQLEHAPVSHVRAATAGRRTKQISRSQALQPCTALSMTLASPQTLKGWHSPGTVAQLQPHS
jgi:hypothetical protein